MAALLANTGVNCVQAAEESGAGREITLLSGRTITVPAYDSSEYDSSEIVPSDEFQEDGLYEVNQFSDVTDSRKFYYTPVYWAVGKSITSGTSTTAFSPEAECTRAQIVTFLWRAAGTPEPQTQQQQFTDVKTGSFYDKAVRWAVEQGITSGIGGGKFGPSDPCTRGQIVTFLWRYQKTPAAQNPASFTDVQNNAFYAKAVAWAVEQGITSGIGGGKFGPADPCTRAQCVTFLYRAVGQNDPVTLPDAPKPNPVVIPDSDLVHAPDKEPEGKFLNVLDYGATPNDNTDDTDAINNAIYEARDSSTVKTVYIPAGKYMINASHDVAHGGKCGVSVHSGVNLVMHKDAILQASVEPSDNYHIIYIRDQHDVTVTGGQLVGERYQHIPQGGDYDGRGIAILDSTNVTVSDVRISSTYGDGIYVGAGDEDNENFRKASTNVTIRNCYVQDSMRNGMSITWADNVKVENCAFKNSHGAQPQFGVDVEANNFFVSNVTFTGCLFDGNVGAAFGVMKGASGVSLKNCQLNGDLIIDPRFNVSGVEYSTSTVNGQVHILQ